MTSTLRVSVLQQLFLVNLLVANLGWVDFDVPDLSSTITTIVYQWSFVQIQIKKDYDLTTPNVFLRSGVIKRHKNLTQSNFYQIYSGLTICMRVGWGLKLIKISDLSHKQNDLKRPKKLAWSELGTAIRLWKRGRSLLAVRPMILATVCHTQLNYQYTQVRTIVFPVCPHLHVTVYHQ